jgi:hypothetical protein
VKNSATMRTETAKKADFILTLVTARKIGETVQKRASRKADGTAKVKLRQRHFILEKLFGVSDKDAALFAGYSLSIAENTKQKIWSRPGVRKEFERLRAQFTVTRKPERVQCSDHAGGEDAQAGETPDNLSSVNAALEQQ